jgi:hypothetical protein
MTKRMPRGVAVLAIMLAVQVALVGWYAWPWPSFARGDAPARPPQVVTNRPVVDPDVPDAPAAGAVDQAAIASESGASVQSGIAVADAYAREWTATSQLVSAQMQIDWPQSDVPDTVTQISRFGWLRYFYLSRTSGGSPVTLRVQIERSAGTVADTNLESVPIAGETVIDASRVSVWDTAAVLAVEMVGGTAFRASCPTVRYTTFATLSIDPDTGALSWLVEYPEDRKDGGDTQPLTARVDATTGEVKIVDPGRPGC